MELDFCYAVLVGMVVREAMPMIRPILVVAMLVGGAAAYSGEPVRDAYLTPLPRGAKARFGMAIERVNSVSHSPSAESPDGKLLAATVGKSVLIWDRAAGKVIQNFAVHTYDFRGLVFLDNDTLLTQGRGETGFDDAVKAWNPRTGQLKRSHDVRQNWAGSAFSHDGKCLAITTSGEPNHLRMYDTRTGKELWFDREHYPTVFFSPDDRFIVTSRHERLAYQVYDTVVTLRDARTGKVSRKLVLSKQQVMITDLSPDGKYFVGHAHVPHAEQAKWRSRIQLFDAETGKLVRTFHEQTSGDMKSAVFSPDGKLLAAVNHADNGLSVWEVETGKKRWTFFNDQSFFNHPRFSRDGKTLVNTTSNGRVFVHDLTTGATRDLNPAHRASVMCLAFSPDGKYLASGSYLSEIFLWEVSTGALASRCEVTRLPKTEPRSWEYAVKLAFAPDGKRLLMQQVDQTVRLFAPFRGVEIRAFRDAGYVWGFSDDGRHLLWTGVPLDLTNRLHNRPRKVDADGPEFWLGCLRWVSYTTCWPEFEQFRCRAYATPDLKNEQPPQGELALVMGEGQAVAATPVGLSPDGTILAERILRLAGNPFSGMGTYWVPSAFRLTDAATGQEILRTKNHPLGEASLIQFAPDSRSIAGFSHAGGDKSRLRLFETRTGQERLTLSEDSGQYGNLALSPDGRWLVHVNSQKALVIHDLAHGKVAASIPQTDLPARFAFSPDGSILATGASSGTILLWDMKELVKHEFSEAAWSAADRDRLWNDLAHSSGAVSFAAIMRMKRSPAAAVELIRERMQWRDANRDLAGLIERLGNADFAVRKKASDAIEQMGERARPALLRSLTKPISLEHKRRAEELLAKLGQPFTSPVGIRTLRAVELLDALRTPESLALLREMVTDGAPQDPLRREAARALARKR